MSYRKLPTYLYIAFAQVMFVSLQRHVPVFRVFEMNHYLTISTPAGVEAQSNTTPEKEKTELPGNRSKRERESIQFTVYRYTTAMYK